LPSSLSKIFHHLLLFWALIALVGAALACGRREPPAAVEARATAAEWARLERSHQALDQLRQQLAGLPAVAGSRGGERERLERKAEAQARNYSTRLVLFLNSRFRGEAADPGLRRQAIRRKSTEDLYVARQYVERAGDYRQAIEICEAALSLDPDNPDLERWLAEAREMRFVTPERFARLKEGMAPAEVRAILGSPNLHNVRSYTGGIVAWFYDRDERGGAAAVWFEPRGKELAVYALAYDAVDPRPGRPPAPPA
jgi:tetratricopeptide (TPR) repeat protein